MLPILLIASLIYGINAQPSSVVIIPGGSNITFTQTCASQHVGFVLQAHTQLPGTNPNTFFFYTYDMNSNGTCVLSSQLPVIYAPLSLSSETLWFNKFLQGFTDMPTICMAFANKGSSAITLIYQLEFLCKTP